MGAGVFAAFATLEAGCGARSSLELGQPVGSPTSPGPPASNPIDASAVPPDANDLCRTAPIVLLTTTAGTATGSMSYSLETFDPRTGTFTARGPVCPGVRDLQPVWEVPPPVGMWNFPAPFALWNGDFYFFTLFRAGPVTRARPDGASWATVAETADTVVAAATAPCTSGQ